MSLTLLTHPPHSTQCVPEASSAEIERPEIRNIIRCVGTVRYKRNIEAKPKGEFIADGYTYGDSEHKKTFEKPKSCNYS